MLTKARISEQISHFEDGTKRTYLLNDIPLKDMMGQLLGSFSVNLDITKQKQEIEERTKALQEKQSFVRFMLPVLPMKCAPLLLLLVLWPITLKLYCLSF